MITCLFDIIPLEFLFSASTCILSTVFLDISGHLAGPGNLLQATPHVGCLPLPAGALGTPNRASFTGPYSYSVLGPDVFCC